MIIEEGGGRHSVACSARERGKREICPHNYEELNSGVRVVESSASNIWRIDEREVIE